MNQQGCGGVSASGERGGGSERDYPAGRAAGAVSSVLPEGAEDAGDGVGVYEPVKDNTAYETEGREKAGRDHMDYRVFRRDGIGVFSLYLASGSQVAERREEQVRDVIWGSRAPDEEDVVKI